MLIFRRFSTARNFYKVLGIAENASSPEIKRAYLELAKKYHPDTSKETDAKERFVEIQQAYETLSDPEKKNLYDQYGAAGPQANANANDFGYSDFRKSDIFNSIFSNFGFGMRNPFQDMGSETMDIPELDVEITVPLSFLEAAKGCKKKIKYPRNVPCSSCNGTGCSKGHSLSNCPTCKGTGQDTKVRNGFIYSRTCMGCSGSGKINRHPCGSCRGNAFESKFEERELDIPAGVSGKAILELSNLGNIYRGRVGHLLVRFQVGKSDIFERKGHDIYSNITVDLLTALCGGSVTVPTIHGDVLMKINSGVQPNDIKKLAGKGITDTGRVPGDHFVSLKIEIPKNLSENQLDDIRTALEGRTKNTDSQESSANEGKQWFGSSLLKFLTNLWK